MSTTMDAISRYYDFLTPCLSFNTCLKMAEPGNSFLVRHTCNGRARGRGHGIDPVVGCELEEAALEAGAESSACGGGIGGRGAGGESGVASLLELLSLPSQTCGLTAAAARSGSETSIAGAAGGSLGSGRSASKNASRGITIRCGNTYSISLKVGSPAASSGARSQSQASSTLVLTWRCKLPYPFATKAVFHAVP